MKRFIKKIKTMKLKIKFGKEIRSNVPSRQIWTQVLSGVRLSLHSLAMAEQPKPCQRHVD
jgi:hypothetical protein